MKYATLGVISLAIVSLAACSSGITGTGEVLTPAIPSIPAKTESDLDYLTGYCYTDCTRIEVNNYDSYLDMSTVDGLELALAATAMFSYEELDLMCDAFWSYDNDQDMLDDIGFDPDVDVNAALAVLYYTCDS